jgi:hypothetical protein
VASRDEVYAKFGITAEAAQLFETELGTIILGISGLQNGWYVVPDVVRARSTYVDINRKTLGQLITNLKKHIDLSDDLETRFKSALDARNRLIHGFYERHNFKIDSDQGRDEIIIDLEILHQELFNAWQVAGAISSIIFELIVKEHRADF